MLRRVAVVIVATALMGGSIPAGWACAGEGTVLTDPARARVSSAVVVIETFNRLGSYQNTVSGFFAAPDWLVTNMHCVEGASEAVVNLGELGVFRVTGLIAEHRELDLVVLKTDVPEGLIRPLELRTGPVARGTPVAVVVRGEDGSIKESPGRVRREVQRGDTPSVITTAPAWLGCSGAPLLDASGVVVGIVNRLGGDKPANALAAPAHLLAAMQVGEPVSLRAWWAAREGERWAEHQSWRDGGERLMEGAKFREAAEAFLAALDIVPTDTRSIGGYIGAMEGLEKTAQAAKWLRDHLAAHGDDAECWLWLGHAHARAEEYQEAATAYRRSLSLRPSAEANYWLGFALWWAGVPVDAAEALETALRLDPEHDEAMLQLEYLCAVVGRLERACEVHLQRMELLGAEWGDETGESVVKALVGAGRMDLAGKIADAAAELTPYRAGRIRAMIQMRQGPAAIGR